MKLSRAEIFQKTENEPVSSVLMIPHLLLHDNKHLHLPSWHATLSISASSLPASFPVTARFVDYLVPKIMVENTPANNPFPRPFLSMPCVLLTLSDHPRQFRVLKRCPSIQAKHVSKHVAVLTSPQSNRISKQALQPQSRVSTQSRCYRQAYSWYPRG